jgi:hypothetical protein
MRVTVRFGHGALRQRFPAGEISWVGIACLANGAPLAGERWASRACCVVASMAAR